VDDNIVPDIEAVYRMVALGCAAMVTQHDKDHHAVMAIADAFLEYIDPIGDASTTAPRKLLTKP
jgi:hypothetical protein